MNRVEELVGLDTCPQIDFITVRVIKYTQITILSSFVVLCTIKYSDSSKGHLFGRIR